MFLFSLVSCGGGGGSNSDPPLTVLSTSPANNATGVDIGSVINITFSETIDISTFNSSTFTLSSGGSSVTGAITRNGAIVTFTPSASLKANTAYTATITTGVKGATGDTMSNNYIWTFTSADIIGILDPTFNTSGIVVHNNAAGGNNNDFGVDIVIDSAGRILVTGGSWNGVDWDMVIWRYNSNGTLDTTFNGTGIVVHNSAAGGNSHDWGNSITIDSSGRILVTGKSWNGTNSDMVIWRYNSNGTLDTTFNGIGFIVHNNAAGGNWEDVGYSISIDSSGRILVAGSSWNGANYDMVIWRYNSNGTLDTTFNGIGFIVHNNGAGGNGDDVGRGIVIDSSGKILVTGYSRGVNYDMVIWRYNLNGTLDTTFNGIGFIVHNNAAGGNGNDYGNSITTDSSGRILVTGESSNATNIDMVIWRYNSNGTLDTTFNGIGFIVHNNAAGGNGDDVGRGIVIDSSGRILVAGYSWNGANYDMVIWRYNSNEILDTTFNGTGIVIHNSAAGGNSYDYGTSITIDSSGKILVTGYSWNGANDDMVIWRYK